MRLHLFAALCLSLAACDAGGTVADAASDAQIEALRGSKTMQRQEHATCVAEFQSEPMRSNLAAVVDRKPADAPRVACDRIMAAVLDGRLTAADLNGMKSGQLDAKVVRVLQGR